MGGRGNIGGKQVWEGGGRIVFGGKLSIQFCSCCSELSVAI